MNIEDLEYKWKGLKPENTGSFKSLRITAECFPDLYIGLDTIGTRCLILKLPANHALDFQSVIKQNLSIELFRDTNWIILKLTNVVYADLFNDLIQSLYNKIKDVEIVKEYIATFIETFYKWSEFFEENNTNRLSEEIIKGIFGELLFLCDIISKKEVALINDLLLSWQGMYDTGHDFIFKDQNTEVKTKELDALDIRISSEYQLEPEPGKPLNLAVVNVLKDNKGITLSDAVTRVRKLVVERLGDFTIVLKALAQKGLTPANIAEYDTFRYIPVNIVMYNCIHEDFPRIIISEIPSLINSVRYNIGISSLNAFIIDKKEF